jgi:hypothetical protein
MPKLWQNAHSNNAGTCGQPVDLIQVRDRSAGAVVLEGD